MSKRRINLQQQSRIQKIQDSYLKNPLEDELSTNEEGIVISRYSKHAVIESTNGTLVKCSIRPNIESLVAGDRIIWQSEGQNQGVVLSRFPRTSELGRPDKRGIARPVAANITQLIIVIAPKPEPSFPLLDSYLVIAEHLHLNACVLLNKTDLPCDDLVQQLTAIYPTLGYPLIMTSKQSQQGFEDLQRHLQNHTSVFVGQSGVGKSSLIATVLPHESGIQIGDISTNSELGRHTTSNSRLYHLPRGGKLIDSPGVREFSLWQMPFIDIVYGFREFRKLAADCKFRNCNHIDAPGCAIIKNIQNNTALNFRYQSMLKVILQNK